MSVNQRNEIEENDPKIKALVKLFFENIFSSKNK